MTATTPARLDLLCAGAAKGLVLALQERFAAECGARVSARFGAVGAMQEALREGVPCDVMIVTATMIDALVSSGELVAASRAVVGSVRTGIAVRTADALPAIDTPDALRAALLGAERVFFPDPERSTAGIHFAAVLDGLGLRETLGPRCAVFPNGAEAMRALAAAGGGSAIGCTQITEINYTEGVRLVGPLPAAFELATVYAAAVATGAAQPALAARFVALVTGDATRPLRLAGGFETAAAPR